MALPVVAALKDRYPKDRLLVLTAYPELFVDLLDEVDIVADDTVCAWIDRYVLIRGASRFRFRPEFYAKTAGLTSPLKRPRLAFKNWETALLSEVPAGDGPLIAVAPGASWRTKRWELERWRALSVQLTSRGARLMELGQTDEPIGLDVSLMDRTTVRDAACLLRTADLLICCDSGLMHLALAVETPVVALFGPTDPEILIRDEPLFHPIRSTLACSGRWNDPGCAMEPGECCGERACCLDTIEVQDVMRQIEQLVTLR